MEQVGEYARKNKINIHYFCTYSKLICLFGMYMVSWLINDSINLKILFGWCRQGSVTPYSLCC